MTIRISRFPIYRRRRFSAETIELCGILGICKIMKNKEVFYKCRSKGTLFPVNVYYRKQICTLMYIKGYIYWQ
jgi:hypothetical protein